MQRLQLKQQGLLNFQNFRIAHAFEGDRIAMAVVVIMPVIMPVVVIVRMVMIASVPRNAYNGLVPIVEANIQLSQTALDTRQLHGHRRITRQHCLFDLAFHGLQ